MQLTDPVPSPEVAQITKVNPEISLSEASPDASEDLSTQAQKISPWTFAYAASLAIPQSFDTSFTGHVTFFPTLSKTLYETATFTALELSTTSSNVIITSMPSVTPTTSPKQSTLALSENKDSSFQSEEVMSLAGLNDLSVSETPLISVKEESRISMKQNTLELEILSLNDRSFIKSSFPNEIQPTSSQDVIIFSLSSAFENSSPLLNSNSPREGLSSNQAMDSSDNTQVSPSTSSNADVSGSENTVQLETNTRSLSTQLQGSSLAQYLATALPSFEPSAYVSQHSTLLEGETSETSYWEELVTQFRSVDSVSSENTLTFTADITPEVLGTLTSQLFTNMADIVNSTTVDNWATFVSSSFTEDGITFLYIIS